MNPSLPPVPGGGGPPQQDPNAAPPPGLTGLVGGAQASTPVGPTPEQRIQAYMEQIRALHMAMDALALEHPEAADDLNNAKNALTNSMSKVATSVGTPNGQPQPPTF